jgi:Zn-dependent alcohol dehydrogenase
LQRAKRLHLTNVVASAALEKAFELGRKLMAAMSRRAMLTNILPGAAVAIAGVGTIGWAVAPEIADAMPLAIDKGNHVKVDDPVVKTQVVVVNPGRRRGRRRRRWVCWWHRGRRRCGWRWV